MTPRERLEAGHKARVSDMAIRHYLAVIAEWALMQMEHDTGEREARLAAEELALYIDVEQTQAAVKPRNQ